MDKRSSKKREHDFAVNAFRVMQEATQEDEEDQPQETPEESVPQEDQGRILMPLLLAD